MDAHTLADLAVFLEVVRCGSLTKAAARLNMVQSNVTARIKKLEVTLAVPLLHRHARGVKPTAAGEAAMALAQRVNALIDDLRFTFNRDSRAHTGKLRVGAIETVLAANLPALIADFGRAHPHIDVSARAGSSASLLSTLEQRELDAVFVSRPPTGSGFRHRIAFLDELVIITPPTVAFRGSRWLAQGPALTVFVQRLGCSYTERLLKFLAAKARRPYRQTEVGALDAIFTLVENGLGIAAMPRGFIAAMGIIDRLGITELPPSLRKLEAFIVTAIAAECTYATNAFFEAIEGKRSANRGSVKKNPAAAP